MLRYKTDTGLVAFYDKRGRKRSGSILTIPEPARGDCWRKILYRLDALPDTQPRASKALKTNTKKECLFINNISCTSPFLANVQKTRVD